MIREKQNQRLRYFYLNDLLKKTNNNAKVIG